MALMCSRGVLQVCRRNLYTSTKCLSKEKANEPPVEQITGLQKREILAEAAGLDDPFNIKIVKRNRNSTRDAPFEIYSAFDSRLVGCICQEDAASVSWMWLYEGPPRRCKCGHWFKLSEKRPL